MAKTTAKKTKAPAAKKPAVTAPAAASGKTVVVALNRVQGLDFPMPDGRVVSIAGNAQYLRGKDTGVLPVGAFGLTEIREDDWLYIEKMWGESPMFKNGLIFASSKGEKDAKAEAQNREDLRNGLEPVDTEKTATEPVTNPGQE